MALKVREFSFLCRNYECNLILSDECITSEWVFLKSPKRI